MIRECTEVENRIIKESAADVLAEPATYKKHFWKNALSLVIGLMIGMTAGDMLTVWIYPSGADRGSERTIFVFTAAVVCSVFMFFWKLLTNRISHKKIIQGKKFRINGGTVINYTTVSKKKAYIIFTEDDLTDTMGRPFCIKYPAIPGLQIRYGERIAIAYDENDVYIPLRMSSRTSLLVQEREPENFYKTDWNEMLCVPHPEGLKMDRGYFEISSEERSELVKKASAVKANRALKWIGNILLAIIILLLVMLVYIVFINKSLYENLGSAAQILSVMMPVYLLIFCVACKVSYHARVKNIGKIQYKKKVVFHSIEMKNNGSTYMNQILVYEYRNGAIELVSYPFANNAFGIKELPYGKVIYNYLRISDNVKKNMHFFDLV